MAATVDHRQLCRLRGSVGSLQGPRETRLSISASLSLTLSGILEASWSGAEGSPGSDTGELVLVETPLVVHWVRAGQGWLHPRRDGVPMLLSWFDVGDTPRSPVVAGRRRPHEVRTGDAVTSVLTPSHAGPGDTGPRCRSPQQALAHALLGLIRRSGRAPARAVPTPRPAPPGDLLGRRWAGGRTICCSDSDGRCGTPPYDESGGVQRELGHQVGARRRVLDGERAAQVGGDVAGDGQAEARTALVAAAGVVEPGEALEDPFTVGGRDARTVVADLQHRCVVGFVHAQGEQDPVVGVALCVVQQIGDEPGEPQRASAHGDRARRSRCRPGPGPPCAHGPPPGRLP